MDHQATSTRRPRMRPTGRNGQSPIEDIINHADARKYRQKPRRPVFSVRSRPPRRHRPVSPPRTKTMTKTSTGNFFEDFRIGQLITHATPRTVTAGDVALYNGLFGPRFAVQSSDAFAQKIGYPRARSTISWSSISCSARPCRTSPSMRSPISAMRAAVSSPRSIRAIPSMRPPRSSGSRRTRAARPASCSCARPAASRTAARCWNMCAG